MNGRLLIPSVQQETGPTPYTLNYSLLNSTYDAYLDGGLYTAPVQLCFSSDGLSMYILDRNNILTERTLSTAWTPEGTTTYTFAIPVNTSAPYTKRDIKMGDSNRKIYISGGNVVTTVSMSTAKTLRTYTGTTEKTFTVQEATDISGIAINSTGTKMLLLIDSTSNATFAEFTLSTAWNMSTASRTAGINVSISFSGVAGSISVNSDGTKLITTDRPTGYNYFKEFTFGTGFSTATMSPTVYTSVSMGTSAATFTSIIPAGTKCYRESSTGGRYSTFSTAWSVSSYSGGSTAYGLSTGESTLVFHGISGTDTNYGKDSYLLATTSKNVYRYNRTTAFNLTLNTLASTMHFGTSVTSTVTGFFVNKEGTRMYLCASTNIYQYNLTTAYDLFSSSYIGSKALGFAGQGVFFIEDGTKMFLTNATGRTIAQFNLSTAWSVSTATAVSTFSVLDQGTTPKGIVVSPDGKVILAANGSIIYQYNLSAGFDLSTALYSGKTLTPTGSGNINNLIYNGNGYELYVHRSSRYTYKYLLM